MKQLIKISILIIILFLFIQCSVNKTEKESKVAWPKISKQTQPWARWWWPGNAVDKKNLKRNLNKYKNVGLGGLEITPIYGVKGYEDKFIDFLSPKWMELLDYTLKVSQKKNLGIDIANTSGWPLGGPWIGPKNTARRMVVRKQEVSGGKKINRSLFYEQKSLLLTDGIDAEISEIKQPIKVNDNLQQLALRQVRFKRPLPLMSVMAYSQDEKQTINLMNKLNQDTVLKWNVPEGDWNIYTVYSGVVGKMVERAGPGGEGRVIDHLSKQALQKHVSNFDTAFAGHDIEYIRAFFNDSYEVDENYGNSNWTKGFFKEFKQRRGYDLRNYLPILIGDTGTQKKRQRILSDYRKTISDLLLDNFTRAWDKWAEKQDAKTRNQAHGSPANILDLYAATDIPETEGSERFRFKFASSATHIAGKELASAEACTWMNQHFKGTLGEVKGALDKYFLGGINHIVYHGIAYSPKQAQWPGWLFYAAVHFGPKNTFWKDFDALNRYVTRVQSFLQKGQPDNDILLYYPIRNEMSQDTEHLLKHFDGDASGTRVKKVGENLFEKGYNFDLISDRQLNDIKIEAGTINIENLQYKTILVPRTEYIPLRTYRKLFTLAQKGASIIFESQLPEKVAGFDKLNKRKTKFRKITKKIKTKEENGNISAGKGNILVTQDVARGLKKLNISSEPMVKEDLHFIRREHTHGKYYFIKNTSDTELGGWIEVRGKISSAMIYDPMDEQKGKAATKNDGSFYLQLEPGETCIVKTFIDQSLDKTVSEYPYKEVGQESKNINQDWKIEFVQGGPQLPEAITTNTLQSWTELGGKKTKRFSGTASYTTTFSLSDSKINQDWLLQLGEVRESAEIFLNGEQIATTITQPHQIVLEKELIKNRNKLKIEVSNLMANRIAYMDKKGLEWKNFYNINLGASTRANVSEEGIFTAKNWEPLASGLLGPVTIRPLKNKEIN